MSELPFNFGGLDEEFARLDSSRIVVLPVPFERTTTYGKGTRLGPRAIIEASRNMELFDEETGGEVFRLGIHTLPEVGTDDLEKIEDCMERFYSITRGLLERNKFIVALGGEHSITFPIVRAYRERFPELSVLQIDAHADLRYSYDGTIYSHASVMRRIVDLCPLVQVGIRSISREEADALPSLRTRIIWAREIRPEGDWIERALEGLSRDVYLTIDIDGLDPSIVPSTGTPEPGGLGWYETLSLAKRLASARNVVGFDLVELMPLPGLAAPNFLAARLAYKILNYVFVK